MAETGEKIVACPPGGLLELNDEVTFEAKHFGIRQRLTSKIVEFDPPHSFTDQMVSGAFKSVRHEHKFRIEGESTRMTDVFEFEAPFGPLGWLAEVLFLRSYMRRLIFSRSEQLKAMAEANSAST